MPALAGTVVIGFLAWPMVFTSSGLGIDWVNHLWELWQQGLTIRHDHLPSLFLNSNSVFVPLYAYYGGTLFALGGALSVALGDPVRAYVALYLFGFAAAYGGWYWLARIAGLGRWLAHAPGLVFITSGYYLSIIYSRGDWPEFMAVSIIPLMVASGLSVLSADRLRALPAIAFASTVVLFFGSHNITLLWGVTLLALLGLAIWIGVPQARHGITRAGLGRTAMLVVPGALINAWYLFPALVYGFRTGIANGFGHADAYSLAHTQYFVAASHLFTFSRASVSSPGFVSALPVASIAWVLAGIMLSLRRGRDSLGRRVLLLTSGLTIVVAIIMTRIDLLLDLPHPYTVLQFSFRLESFVMLGVAGAILAALVAVQPSTRARQIWSWMLPAVLIASAVGAVEQVDDHPNHVPDRQVVLTNKGPPFYWFTGVLQSYYDSTQPLVTATTQGSIYFPSTAVHRDRVAVAVRVPAGTRLLVTTNLMSAPYLLTVSGARVVGRGASNAMVLRLPAGGRSRERIISVRRSDALPIVLGRLVTFAALAFWAAIAFIRRLRGGRDHDLAVLSGLAALPLAYLSGSLLLGSHTTPSPSRVSVGGAPPARVDACPSGTRGVTSGPPASHLRVIAGWVTGKVEHSVIIGKRVQFCGWALGKDRHAAKSIVIIANGRSVGAVTPTVSRPDITYFYYQRDGVVIRDRLGFSVELPASRFERNGRKAAVQAFAIEHGVASSLPFDCATTSRTSAANGANRQRSPAPMPGRSAKADGRSPTASGRNGEPGCGFASRAQPREHQR